MVVAIAGEGDAATDVLRFLAEEAGLGPAGAAKAITGHPPLRNLSVAEKLAPRLRSLVEGAGLGRERAPRGPGCRESR